MKQRQNRVHQFNKITNFLVLGLIVLICSIAICAVHVLTIQRCFREVAQNSINGNMDYATALISDQVLQGKSALSRLADIVANNDLLNEEKSIQVFVSQYNSMQMFDRMFYVKTDGTVIGPYATEKLEEQLLNEYLNVTEPTIRIDKNRARNNDNGVMYFVIPVTQNGIVQGYILAVNSFGPVFDGSVFNEMYRYGDLFLMSEEGMIYAQRTNRMTELSSVESENNPNLFLRMEEECLDDYFKREIKKLSVSIKGRNTGFSNFYIDEKNEKQYYEIRKIDSVEGLCFAYVFPEDYYFSAVNKVVQKALLSASMVVFLTMSMLFYMWFSAKQANEMISSLAYDDPVTGGKNDKYFRDQANFTVFKASYNIPYSLVRFDIVNFRYINEAYGHVRADALLKLVYEETSAVFANKEYCSRMTADQFLLLARNDADFDSKYADVQQSVNEKARELGIKFPIRFKSGIYQIRKEESEIGIAIDRANAARKTLRGDEKDTMVVYSDKIIRQMFEMDRIESEMEQAMANNEFKVFIQLKWNIAKNRIYGGEALVRWIKPDGRRIYPDVFIPIFEKNGFVEKLDLYMLEEVCKYLRGLIDENRRIFPISVNQSRILLHNPEYINTVAKILKKYRIPPGFIELEITETVFQDQRDIMISTIQQLKNLDVHVSMDDFGSGYSSLNMLKDIPFDVIKIDREFFSESITSNSSTLILQKIVEMAEGLGIHVLCEGVETENQVALLKSLGVNIVQGYYFAKPVPAEEFFKKYCRKKKDGKQIYEEMYDNARRIRLENTGQKEHESEMARNVSDAVLQFKKHYRKKENVEEKSKPIMHKADGKTMKLSQEEMKILAREEKNESE